VGSGTNPLEATALGMLLLEFFAEARALLTMATTHHGELKTLKYSNDAFENACIEFNEVNLKPTYRILWGIPGRSNAINIAERIGLPNVVVGVIPTTSVSRPQLKSNPLGDRVMHNNSQGKKEEVGDPRRSVKLSKNKTFVTACNDSLNAKTLNVKSVSAMCDKCVLIDKHDMCALKYVAKPLKKTVASESHKKLRNLTRNLYERLIEIILFIVDSGCSKNMTRNLKLLINFVEKFLGTVKFGNDQIAPIIGYGDLEVNVFYP
nr:DNA mismatch repair protein MutS, core [Tanacetum cinerariifolium]